MNLRAVSLALVLLAVVGCDKGRGKSPAPVKATLAVFVDDRSVATSVELIATPRPLSEVVPGAPPVDTWLAVVAIDGAGRATTVMEPAKQQPDAVPSLVAERGAATFGMARGGKLEGAVAAVTKVIIKTKDDRGAIAAEVAARGGRGGGDSGGGSHDETGERPTPTAELTIAIAAAGGETTFTGDKLVGLPTITAPTGGNDAPGWNLVDVLRRAGLDRAKAVIVTDSEGATLRLEGGDFDPARTVLFLKLNRNGQLRFRRYGKVGTAWEMTGELRGVSRIAVAP